MRQCLLDETDIRPAYHLRVVMVAMVSGGAILAAANACLFARLAAFLSSIASSGVNDLRNPPNYVHQPSFVGTLLTRAQLSVVKRKGVSWNIALTQ